MRQLISEASKGRKRTGSALNTYVTLYYSVESHEGKGRAKQVAKDGQGISYKYLGG